MSAVAHTSIDQTNIASVQLNSEPAVTSISVSARIDYIQRFSKQAVLVIDQEVAVYTQAARQFLINLSKEKSTQETNVAFVPASTKLNDIQMRCRLIEQLFANTLFDPEKSLAVSILNLSKQNKDSITIVVEHAHALSLQMKYELCQLVDVANKTHCKINVVLFGQEQAAQQAATNKSIFKNKLAIIDAKSGQLFSLDHTKFNNENSIFTNKFGLKLVITVVLISALIGLSWFVMINYDDFSLSQLPAVTTDSPDKNSTKSDSTLISNKDNKNEKGLVTNDVIVANNTKDLAGTADIHAALLGEVLVVNKVENTRAQTTDILQALDLIETKSITPLAVESKVQLINKLDIIKEQVPSPVGNQELKQKINHSTNKLIETVPTLKLTPNYYLNSSTGYVVQIVGFTDITLLARFIDKYPSLEYFSYQKKLNEQMFVVLTTKVFDNKKHAQQALQDLPQAIIDRGVWIKALSIVQAEINES